jgi:hypothetical protein
VQRRDVVRLEDTKGNDDAPWQLALKLYNARPCKKGGQSLPSVHNNKEAGDNCLRRLERVQTYMV